MYVHVHAGVEVKGQWWCLPQSFFTLFFKEILIFFVFNCECVDVCIYGQMGVSVHVGSWSWRYRQL